MITSDFHSIFEKHPIFMPHFQGVYGANTLKTLKVNKFCIVNNQPIELEGQHWRCFYRDTPSTLECFDSLGISAEEKENLRIKFQRSQIKEIDFNTCSVQRPDTSTCGQFCLYYIFHRLLNQDLEFDILLNEIFTADLDDNEKKVNDYFKGIIESKNGN
jgi:hypothetical protein